MFTKNSHRARRLSREIAKNVAIILQRRVNDHRIGIVTVSGVDMSKDLIYARVFVTFLDKNKDIEIKNGIFALRFASGFIRRTLSKIMCLRIVPNLIFIYDSSVMNGIHMNNLITQVVTRDSSIVE